MIQLNHSSNLIAKQSGLALPLTLILLFVMTLIGVATLRTTTFEENMTANSRLRQIAFNLAESTLREAEDQVRRLPAGERRTLFFGAGRLRPDPLVENPGDTCTGGYCTPAQFTSPASVAADGERWEDPNLDVWNNPNRHIEYTDFENDISNINNVNQDGVVEAPRYIVELLGNYTPNERDVRLALNPSLRPEFTQDEFDPGRCDLEGAAAETWPYCTRAPAVYRITARATAGPPARRAVVLLQSTFRFVN